MTFSKTNSADSETIHDCLVDLISKLGLELKNLKAFSSDGASVMTGGNTGVAARLRQHQVLKCMLNIHCICHRLALACADSSDQLIFLKEFETTLIQLWAFFKNSPKRLNIYTKTALKMHDLDSLPPKKKKNVVKKIKKAVNTRWLSLHASVDRIYDEYPGLLETMNVLEMEGGTGGSMAKGFAKTLKSPKFLGMLYTLKVMLPSLTALSKTFQTGAINFSRIIPNLNKSKAKLQQLLTERKPLNLLKDDVGKCLTSCDLIIDVDAEEKVHSMTERYTNAMIWNINERIPSDVMNILEAFSIFNLESIPTDQSSHEFTVHGNHEVNVLCSHFFEDNEEKKKEFLEEWQSFKFDMLSLRKKWISLKENLSHNNLKQQSTATEWALKQICASVNCDKFPTICSLAKIDFIIPVSNAWPERDGSAIKRIKNNKRSTMKNDALNALLMISLNGPKPGTPNAAALLKRVAKSYGQRNQYKKASVVRIKAMGTQTEQKETQTVYIESESVKEAEERLDMITSDEYTISNWAEESDSSKSKIHHLRLTMVADGN